MKKREKSAGGRIRSAKELSRLIDGYFGDCAGKQAINASGEQAFDKSGLPIVVGERPPTVAGLAFALGLRSRAELFSLREKSGLEKPIERALLRIEAYTTERLFESSSARGAEYLLKLDFDRAKEDASDETPASGPCGVIFMPRAVEGETLAPPAAAPEDERGGHDG